MEENHFHVDIISIFVQEVFQEDRHGLKGDVATDDNVPERRFLFFKRLFSILFHLFPFTEV